MRIKYNFGTRGFSDSWEDTGRGRGGNNNFVSRDGGDNGKDPIIFEGK